MCVNVLFVISGVGLVSGLINDLASRRLASYYSYSPTTIQRKNEYTCSMNASVASFYWAYIHVVYFAKFFVVVIWFFATVLACHNF